MTCEPMHQQKQRKYRDCRNDALPSRLLCQKCSNASFERIIARRKEYRKTWTPKQRVPT